MEDKNNKLVMACEQHIQDANLG